MNITIPDRQTVLTVRTSLPTDRAHLAHTLRGQVLPLWECSVAGPRFLALSTIIEARRGAAGEWGTPEGETPVQVRCLPDRPLRLTAWPGDPSLSADLVLAPGDTGFPVPVRLNNPRVVIPIPTPEGAHVA